MNYLSNEVVVFEDAISGIRAAKNGGFFCVGVNRYNKIEIDQLANLSVKKFHISLLKKIFLHIRKKNKC